MRSHDRLRALLLMTGAVFATACRDELPSAATDVAARVSASRHPTTTQVADTAWFVVDPDRPVTQVIGDHKIKFTERAICDPATANYEAMQWDAPCEVATGPVRIRAIVSKGARGRPRVDFAPALRFNPRARVTLYLMDKSAAKDPDEFSILWIDTNGALVDESLADPTLATRVGKNDYLYRRIKHFSGYIVSTGRALDGDGDGESGDGESDDGDDHTTY